MGKHRLSAALTDTATVDVHGVETAGNHLTVTLHVKGIDPSVAGQTFPAHVHVNACGDTPSSCGGHAKHDPSITTGGTAEATAQRDWVFGAGSTTARSEV